MNNTIKLSIITGLFLNTNLMAEEKLEEILVISATKTSQNIKDITSNTDIITAQEIEERHYTTVTQALNSLSGINFSSNGGLGQTTSLYLRGMASKRLLVLVDGVRQNDITGLNGADFSNLLIGDIAQIEVIKGAQSGIWGADASAGVINIISKKAKKGFHGNLSAEFGEFKTTDLGASLSYAEDNYYVKLHAKKLETDGYSAQVPLGDDVDKYEDDGYKNSSFALSAGLSIDENNKIEISHKIVDSENEFDGGGFADSPEDKANNNTFDSSSKSKFSRVDYHNKNTLSDINIYASNSDFSREFPSYGSNYDGAVREYGANAKVGYRDEDFVIVGADYKKFSHDNAIGREYKNRAIFITNSNSFSKKGKSKTILTQSLRRDIYTAFDSKTTGKIGLKRIHHSIDDFTTSFNYGTAYNVPTLNNLYDPFSGNRDLNSEETSSWDVSAEWKDIKITYFKTKVEDMIDYVSIYDAEGNWLGGKYDNIKGTSKIKGVELAYETNIAEDFLISTSYTHLDANNEKGERLARRAKGTLKLGVDYYGIENLHLGLSGEYVGKRYNRDDEKGKQTGKYSVANFTANYKVSSQLNLYGKVDNIMDKNYQTIEGYSTSPRAIYVGMGLNY